MHKYLFVSLFVYIFENAVVCVSPQPHTHHISLKMALSNCEIISNAVLTKMDH